MYLILFETLENTHESCNNHSSVGFKMSKVNIELFMSNGRHVALMHKCIYYLYKFKRRKKVSYTGGSD